MLLAIGLVVVFVSCIGGFTIAGGNPGHDLVHAGEIVIIVGIGIGKRPTSGRAGSVTIDRPRGILSWWGPDEPEHGRMMVALKVDPKMIAEIREDADNYLVLLKVQPGQPFVYYSGSAWNLGQDHVNSREAWDKLVAAETVDFDPAH